MSQISRPFQIALLAICVLAAAWLVAFQGHSSSTNGTASSSTVVASPAPTSSTAAAEAQAAGAPTKVYHGSAPGVQGLSRAIAEAHGAVATSQHNANELQSKSAQASSPTAAGSSSSAGAGTATPNAAAAKPAHTNSSSASVTTSAKPTHPGASASTPASKTHTVAPKHAASTLPGTPAGQRKVEAQLARGDVVIILFWNPQGIDDTVVHKELQSLVKSHRGGKVAVNEAGAGQAASFGSITHSLQVYGTPTMLIVNKHGKTIVLTGLQDVFSIAQAIGEARSS